MWRRSPLLSKKHSTAKRARSFTSCSEVLDLETPAAERPCLPFAAARTTIPKFALGEDPIVSASKPLPGAAAVSLAALSAAAKRASSAAPDAVRSAGLLLSAAIAAAAARQDGEEDDNEAVELCLSAELPAGIPSLSELLRPCLASTPPAGGFPARAGKKQ